jgi:hypothetical protein
MKAGDASQTQPMPFERIPADLRGRVMQLMAR